MHGRTIAARLVNTPRSNQAGWNHTKAADKAAATMSARPEKAFAEYQSAGLDNVAGVRKPYDRFGPTRRSASGMAMTTRNAQMVRATPVGMVETAFSREQVNSLASEIAN